MKKKSLTLLKFQKRKIASLNVSAMLYGGQSTHPDCGGSNTDDDSEEIKKCPKPAPQTKPGAPSCVMGCPSILNSRDNC